MIDIIILCPLRVEYMAVRKFLPVLTAKRLPKSALTYECGSLEIENVIWNVALFETDKYLADIQLKTHQILDELQPTYAFLVGIAGGVRDVEIGDIVIGTKAYTYEYGKAEKEGIKNIPTVEDFSDLLIEQTKQLDREQEAVGFKRIFGPINSGNKVIKDKNSQEFKIISSHYPDTIAVEMESYGFATAASKFQNTYFINIRGISDLIENKGASDKTGSQELASQRAAKFTFDLIKRLGENVQNIEREEIQINYISDIGKLRSYVRTKAKSAILLISGNAFMLKISKKKMVL